MQQPTEEIGWVVTVLLVIAAIVANIPEPEVPTNFGFILMIILLAVCGVLAMRYEERDGPS